MDKIAGTGRFFQPIGQRDKFLNPIIRTPRAFIALKFYLLRMPIFRSIDHVINRHADNNCTTANDTPGAMLFAFSRSTVEASVGTSGRSNTVIFNWPV